MKNKNTIIPRSAHKFFHSAEFVAFCDDPYNENRIRTVKGYLTRIFADRPLELQIIRNDLPELATMIGNDVCRLVEHELDLLQMVNQGSVVGVPVG